MATEKAPMIYSAMNSILSEIGAIKKEQTTTGGARFKFRGIDQIYSALHELLKVHSVFMLPEILDRSREERTNKNGTVMAFTMVRVKYSFLAKDGSFVSCVMEGEGMDAGDKSTMKAMSIAHKYAILQTFCIPTEDMIDPDKECHEVVAPAKPSEPTPAEHKKLTDASLSGSKAFRIAWKAIGHPLTVSVEQTAVWKSNADKFDNQQDEQQ